jgi:hypothetical protein
VLNALAYLAAAVKKVLMQRHLFFHLCCFPIKSLYDKNFADSGTFLAPHLFFEQHFADRHLVSEG